MCVFFFLLIHLIRSTNRKKEKIKFPRELLAEIINLLPLNSKWVKLQVSLIFDLFLLKNQCFYVVYLKKFVNPFRALLGQGRDRVGVLNVRLGPTRSLRILEFLCLTINNFYTILQELGSAIGTLDAEFNHDFLEIRQQHDNLPVGQTVGETRNRGSRSSMLVIRLINRILDLNQDVLYNVNPDILERTRIEYEELLNCTINA